MILLFLAVASGIFVLYVSRCDVAERITVSAMSLWLLYESVLGMMQLFGFAVSMRGMFQMTGTFSNPGPYGGFISACTAVSFAAAWRWRDSKILLDRMCCLLAVISGISGVIVLPASMSRAAWAASVFSAFVFILAATDAKRYMKCHKGTVISAVAVLSLMAAGAFSLKKDSASGRFHIWEMECRAIAEKPFSGHGYGRALGAYGDAQAEYFESADRSAERIRIAGCPEYAFNEYLRAGVEFGIPGLLLSVAAVAAGSLALMHGGSALAYGLISWGVFAWASYPMSVWQLVVLPAVFSGAAAGMSLRGGKMFKISLAVFGILLSVVSLVSWIHDEGQRKTAEYRWHDELGFSTSGISDGAADSLALLYPQLRTEFRYLYDYGYALHREGRYEESNLVLREGASISSDPMFYDIIGKNFEAMGNFRDAERNYMHAHFMVPSRLYPYILLMEMEERLGNRERALAYAEKVMSMPVNPRNASMANLQKEAESYYETWKGN